MTIVVIAAEGDSLDTEQVYVRKLEEHYKNQGKIRIEVFVLKECCEGWAIRYQIRDFITAKHLDEVELHAQAGLGAKIAWSWMQHFPKTVHTVFLVGGAPTAAMTGIAKIFHRYFVWIWYFSPIKFFADDPNPDHDEDVEKIRASSTAAMRANPKLYRDELASLADWHIPAHWRPPEDCQVFFVPNGQTKRPKWWDNTYDNEKATKLWQNHGVKITEQPGRYFSMYSMMPAEALFEIMDQERTLM